MLIIVSRVLPRVGKGQSSASDGMVLLHATLHFEPGQSREDIPDKMHLFN